MIMVIDNDEALLEAKLKPIQMNQLSSIIMVVNVNKLTQQRWLRDD